MERNQRRRAHATRRSFIGSLGLAAAGLGAASQTSTATDLTIDSDSQYVVEQGDKCVPVVPLSGDVPVEERYGWAVEGADFSATGLVDLQRPDTTILFLYDGPNGLSLVVVHDEYGNGTNGGSVTFEFVGLPPDGEWVVQDDYYDGESNFDQWTRDGEQATVDWTWADSRTDGGAFRGVGTDPDLELRIYPSFNAEATLYGEYYDGEITAWEVLSASADGPTRTSLALDEPILLRRGTCSTDETSDDGKDSDDSDDNDDSKEGDDSEDSNDNDENDDNGDSEDGEDSDDVGDDEDKDDDHEVDGEDDDDDDDDDEAEDDDDEDDDEDHPGKGKGHEKGRGKGHENGKGKGHERHGDGHDDESGKRDGDGEDKSKGKGNGKSKGRKK